MIKIWAKTLKRDKILKQYVYQADKNMDYSEFFDILTEISYNLDIPTPILIKAHIFNFAKYNFVRFLPSDFIESVPFDKLVLENISDK